ncbi:Dimer_Tnp_hAT domain-containing protein [Cephalotus follicularis]|uniref:Dimer_Tnp_hAT domain-containing protein n=1 Tax=Cephalotus follicularis TaxID=3775 RepID=A0A1Q3CET9_CEPFO|nr:Dimer_Tnp_hAT domain-containing protein [Cephalotus follicularis]
MVLDDQLETYIIDMRSCNDCFELKGIGDLAKKLIDQKKYIVYPLVYKLMKFALILPVATATVERVFSAMKIVKNRLRNRMGDEWMNDCEISASVPDHSQFILLQDRSSSSICVIHPCECPSL